MLVSGPGDGGYAARMRDGARRATQAASDALNAALGTEWAARADRWLRDAVDAKATAASRAMDSEFVASGVGGSWHRLFDGGHDLLGAWRAVRSVAPDEAWLATFGTWAGELWKDLATPRGLPLFTWDKAQFDALCGALHAGLGVGPDWVRDMACFTATEAGGAIAAVAALLVGLRARDPGRYFEMCGSLGVAALVAANPILLAVWLVVLLGTLWSNRRALGWRSATAVARGVATAGIVMGLTGAGGWPGLVLAVPIAYGANRGLRRAEAWLTRGRARRAARALRAEVTSLRLPSPDVLLGLPRPAPAR